MHYDYVVIGAGIAGLYMAYTLRQKEPNARILILEKSHSVGGRTHTMRFAGTNIQCGAGVGRTEKDHLLTQLLHDLHVPYREYTANKAYNLPFDPPDLRVLTHQLRNASNSSTHTTFRAYAKKQLGTQLYNQYVATTGYSDFEDADASDVLRYYGMDDNYGTSKIMFINWGQLVKALVSAVRCQIKRDTAVTSITYVTDDQSTIQIHCGPNRQYSARKCIVATTIDALRSLFPTMPIYKHIHGQPFMRQYAQFSKQSRPFIAEAVTTSTIVTPPLQEIIPIDAEKGVYMIAYADNKSALALQPHSDDTAYFERCVASALSIPVDHVHITKMSPHYWDIGTHYYDPLQKQYATRQDFIKAAQHPQQNVWVVGEAVALHQGWVEGALQSVNMNNYFMHQP